VSGANHPLIATENDTGAFLIPLPLVAGPFAIAAAILVVSGIAKLAKPDQTIDALRAASLPASTTVVVIIAVAELAAGASALIVGGPWTAIAVLALYCGFLAFIAISRSRKASVGGCGCLGARSDTPPGAIHVMFNLLAASMAAIAVMAAVPGIAPIVSDHALDGMTYLAFVGLGTWLSVVLLTDLPRLNAIVRKGIG
jgi:uncharacterized membrane protein YphA (DoxX/SURF4 family)